MNEPEMQESREVTQSGKIVPATIVTTLLQRNAWSEKKVEFHAFREPFGWLDHFKIRWLPQFILSRWPVRYRNWRLPHITTVSHYRVCPHTPADDLKQHGEWLSQQYTPPT
jgi:hypothetical protein